MPRGGPDKKKIRSDYKKIKILNFLYSYGHSKWVSKYRVCFLPNSPELSRKEEKMILNPLLEERFIETISDPFYYVCHLYRLCSLNDKSIA
jgi:hypothetical protein